MTFPHLRHNACATRLIVDGEPFLILGGEIGNSTASSAAAMAPVWPALRRLNLNTVLAPVYWEHLERDEGKFDFSSVDRLLAEARANRMRLVLLWFGAWKNSMSTYVPQWVKRDSARFPHARSADGRPVEILSAFGEATRAADTAAYTALLRHLRAMDGGRHTVVMVQIENEIGFLPDAREHGPLADAAWAQPVPPALIDRLRQRDALEPELRALWKHNGARTSGTWAEIFGAEPAGQEVFMAWHYGRFIDELSARGKTEYPLPTFVNAALNRPGRSPGQYPSAGPLPHLLDVWQTAAPSVDIFCPDIYFFDFADWAQRYARRPGNVLFVPEATRTARAPANAMVVIAGERGIGYSPFQVEFTAGTDAEFLADTYSALRHLTPLLTGRAPSVAIESLSPKVSFDGSMNPTPQIVTVGPYRLTVTFEGVVGASTTHPTTGGDPAARGSALPRCGGMICFTAADEYAIVGTGLKVTHASVDGAEAVGLLDVEEWRPEAAGEWREFRRLNGDQTHQGREIRLGTARIEMQRVRLYRFR